METYLKARGAHSDELLRTPAYTQPVNIRLESESNIKNRRLNLHSVHCAHWPHYIHHLSIHFDSLNRTKRLPSIVRTSRQGLTIFIKQENSNDII